MTKFSVTQNCISPSCYALTIKWLNSQGIVIAGYWDNVAGVNLLHLVTLWREAQLDGEALEDTYPYAADNFQIKVVSSEENKYVQDILPDFEGCPHVKIWCMGSQM